MEPTITFILQEKGIVVLNNEQGFSFNNIKALCDVGNSTKKDVNTGYIGKKGIGFKSVFRVPLTRVSFVLHVFLFAFYSVLIRWLKHIR